MWFKIFQLLLRWFPAFQRWVKKRRSKKSLLHRTAFNEAFYRVSVDPEKQGSIHRPREVNSPHVAFLHHRVEGLSNARVRGYRMRIKFGRELEQFLGYRLSDSIGISNRELKDMKNRMGDVYRFHGEANLWVLVAMGRSYSSMMSNNLVLVFLEAPAEEFDIFTSTLQWESGAVRKKDLPITHILQTKKAVKLITKAAKEASRKEKR